MHDALRHLEELVAPLGGLVLWKALRMVKLSDRSGFESWGQLKQEYDVHMGNRFTLNTGPMTEIMATCSRAFLRE